MSTTAKTSSLQNGKYLIKQVLGQSGLGLTLQGVHAQSNRLIVFKTLKPEWKRQPEFPLIKQRFQEQIHRFANCHHPGLVRIIDTFEEDSLPFAVMDYTPGQTLQSIVKTKGVLSEQSAIHYIKQLCSALTELHQHGLIHRDVTPRNIIRPPNTQIVVLTNFGLTDASVLGLSSDKFPPLAGAYAAIEQYQTELSITPATDVYSLAATLYFLLTGHEPLSALRRGDARLPSPRQYSPQLAATLETAILRGLELNPKKRPGDIASWLSLLTQATSPPLEPSSAGTTEQMRTNTSSSKVSKKDYSAPLEGTYSRSESTSKGKTRPVSISSAIASSKHFPKIVFSTALAAAGVGLGIGLMLRLAASSTGPGASFFHTEQAFPVLDNWPGEVDPVIQPPVYSSPNPYNVPESSSPAAPSQPVEPSSPVAPAPEIAPLPEQSAEEIAPASPPAPEFPEPPAAANPSIEAVPPEPAPAPVEPAAPPSFSEPVPPEVPSEPTTPEGSATQEPPPN